MKLVQSISNMVYEHYRRAVGRLGLPFDKCDLWRKTALTLKLSAKSNGIYETEQETEQMSCLELICGFVKIIGIFYVCKNQKIIGNIFNLGE